jgi:hypothetical protein
MSRNILKKQTGTGLAVLSLAAALAGVAAMQLLFEMPRPRERLIDLWQMATGSSKLAPIRTVSAETRDAVAPSVMPLPVTALDVQVEPFDPDVTGSIPTSESETTPVMTASRSTFGADVGGSGNIRDIRALWASIQPGLRERGRVLQPRLVFQDGAPMQQLRLVVGPVANAGDVATVCAMMPPGIATCTVAPFDGQPLPSN